MFTLKLKNQLNRKDVIQTMIVSRFESKLQSNLSKWMDKKCPFCGEKTDKFAYCDTLCDKCVDKLNRVPVKDWKAMKHKAYSTGNRKMGSHYSRIFRHRRAGKLIGIDPMAERGQYKEGEKKSGKET